MIEHLSKKSVSGDLSINLAKRYLANDEWGLARRALEEGLKKGELSDPEQAHRLFDDVCQRLSIRI